MDLRKLMLAIGASVVIGGSALAATKAPPPQKVEVINTVQTSEVAKAEKPDPTARPCKPLEDVRTSELCAQWAAIDTARRSELWAFAGVVISALTLISVMVGFQISSKNQRIEYSARIGTIIKRAEIVDNRAHITTELINYGRTPAIDLTIEIIPELNHMEEGREYTRFEKTEYPGHIIHPQPIQYERVYVCSDMGADAIKLITRGNIIGFILNLKFRTAFGRIVKQRELYLFKGVEIIDGSLVLKPFRHI